ncbi:DUF2528 family protein [Providencia sp. PROV077]|uniref:DUF2528 family protein n=1 Tax=Providencia sp. PROV077 TaxID=2949799 RepID=UPI00234AED8C|nr:DUF2528 family protein [Providencia sp. PROV077]
MAREIKVTLSFWPHDLDMTVTVLDEIKFKRCCEGINKFFSSSGYREVQFGSHEKAGFALFCAECFQQIAFNNFKSVGWLTRQFDWSKGGGIEGYPDLDSMGITIDAIEPWFIDCEQIEITGWDES